MPGYKKPKQKRRPRKKPQTAVKKDVHTQKAKAKPEDVTTASTPEIKLQDIDDRQQSTWYATTDDSVMAATSSDVKKQNIEAIHPEDDEYKQDALSEISDFSTRSSEFEVLWKKYQTGDEAAPHETKQGKEAKFGYETSDGAGFVEMRRSKKYCDDSTPVLGPMAEDEESAVKAATDEDSTTEDPRKVIEMLRCGKKVGQYMTTNFAKEDGQKVQSIAPSGDVEHPVRTGTSKQMIPKATKSSLLKYSKKEEGPNTFFNPENKVQDPTKCQEKPGKTNDDVPKSSGAISKKTHEISDKMKSCKKKKKSSKKKKDVPSIEMQVESTDDVNYKNDKEDTPLEISDISSNTENKENRSDKVVDIASNKEKEENSEKTSEGIQEISTIQGQKLIGDSQEKAVYAKVPDHPAGQPGKILNWVISGPNVAYSFKISPYAPRNFHDEGISIKDECLNIHNSKPTEDSSPGTKIIKETTTNDEHKINPSVGAKQDKSQQIVYNPKDKVKDQSDIQEESTKTNGLGEVQKKSTDDANEDNSCIKKKKSIKTNKSETDKLKQDAPSGMIDVSKKYQISEESETHKNKQDNIVKIESESSDEPVNAEMICAKKHDDNTEEVQPTDPVTELQELHGSAVPSAESSNNDLTENNEGASESRNIEKNISNEGLNGSENPKGDISQDTIRKPEDKGNKKKIQKKKNSTEIVKKISSDKSDAKSSKIKFLKKKKTSPLREVQKENTEVNSSKKEEFKYDTPSEMSDASTRSSEFEERVKKQQTNDKVIHSENMVENAIKLIESHDVTELKCDKKTVEDTQEMKGIVLEPMLKVTESPENEESDEECHYKHSDKVTVDNVPMNKSNEDLKKIEDENIKNMFDVKICKKKKSHKKNKKLLRELKKNDIEANKLMDNTQESLPEGVAEMGCAKKLSDDPQHAEFSTKDPMTEDAASSGKSDEDTSIDDPKKNLKQIFIDSFKVVEHVSDYTNIPNVQIVTDIVISESKSQTTANGDASQENPPKEDIEEDTAYNLENKEAKQIESKDNIDDVSKTEEDAKETKQATNDFFTVKSCKSMKKWCKKKKTALRSPVTKDANKSVNVVEEPVQQSEEADVDTSKSNIVQYTTECPGTSTQRNKDNMPATNKDSSNVYKPPPIEVKPLIIHVSSSCSFSTSPSSSPTPTSDTKVANKQKIKKPLVRKLAYRKNRKRKVPKIASTSTDNLINGAMTIQRFRIEGVPKQYCVPSYISGILKTREFGMNFSKSTEEVHVRGNSIFIKTADRSFGGKIKAFGNAIGYPVKVTKVGEYKIPDVYFSCVIRGVHKTISAEEVYNILRKDNFRINRVYRIISAMTGNVTRFIRVITYNKKTIDDLLQNGVKIFGELYRCEPSNSPKMKKKQEPKTPDPTPESATFYADISNNPNGNKEIIRNMTMALIEKIPPTSKSIFLKLKNDGKRFEIGIADDPFVLDPKEWPTLN